MTITEMFSKDLISIQAFKTCVNNEIQNLFELQEYYKIFENFKLYRNCDDKTNLELICICSRHSDLYDSNKTCKLNKRGRPEKKRIVTPAKSVNYVDESHKLYCNLDSIRRFIIDNKILLLTSNLSSRSKNALKIYFEDQINLDAIITRIFTNDDFNVKNIKNIGDTSKKEISEYLTEIQNFTFLISDIRKDEELLRLKMKYLILNEFTEIDFPNNFEFSTSIFKIVNDLINTNILFDQKRTFILKNTHKVENGSVFRRFDSIGTDIGIQGERVRQIKSSQIGILITKLNFLKSLNKDFLYKYEIDLEENFIFISDEKIRNINLIDEVNLSKPFISFILYLVLNPEFNLVGNVEDVLVLKSMNAQFRHNWSGVYLVKSELIEIFNFDEFIKDFYERFNERNVKSCKFIFKEYISKFLKNGCFTNLNEISTICEKIILEEFNLFLSIDKEIIFERKTIKSLTEYAYEALEILGKPSHIDDINTQIKLLKPDYNNDITSSSLKQKDGFISFSKTSIFGLKKWEDQNDDIKGGTIKKMVYDLLIVNKSPLHLLEIMEAVTKFRSTSHRSLLNNLKLDPDNAFDFYNQRFIGLKILAKSYDVEKYNKLPVQLGKKIIGLRNRGFLANEELVIDFLFNQYNLTEKEAKCIIFLLNNNLELFK